MPYKFTIFAPNLLKMFRPLYISLVIVSIIIFSSCRPARTVVSPARTEPTAQGYIDKYKDLAVSEMRRTGVPASITLAQGMIESNFGMSTLAREGNNHFGIKCHNDWKGPTIRHHDDRRNECFRKYKRPEDSFYDHSDFLKSGSRYRFLFDLSPTDYKAWARGLKKAGYATNPDYANMLIRKIEENDLHYFDMVKPSEKLNVPSPVASKKDTATPVPGNDISESVDNTDNFIVSAKVDRVREINRVRYVILKDGETLKMIQDEFQLLNWELQRYNELKSGYTPVAGQILYLQPKRDRAEAGKETHTTAEGETMYLVSQMYGVKVKKLYEYNRMTEGDEPVAGQTLWLRAMKPVM